MKIKNEIVKNIIIFIVLLIAVAGVILVRELNNLDELWNFNFARNVADGKIPYKDFNMLQTPLSALITGLALKMLGNELIVMRILACFVCALILFVSYNIMRLLNISRNLSLICLMFLYYLFYDYFTIDYNFIILLIQLSLLYFELKNLEKDNIKSSLLLGILAGTTILFKQTSGLIVILIFIFYKILDSNNKNNFKKVIKEILIRFLGISIPIIIGILYFLLTNSLMDFINYAIKGVKTFSNNFVIYTELFKDNNLIIRLISLILPIASIVMYFLTVVKNQKTSFQKRIFILFSYGIMELSIVFPIATSGYLIMGMIINFIAIMYMLEYWYEKVIKDKLNVKVKLFSKYFFEGIIIIIILIKTIFNCINLGKFLMNAGRYKELMHFKYIQADSIYIKKIEDFIKQHENQGKTVYILDATAAIYMIPLDKYNKDYDMFLIGNLGANGEEGQIEKIKSMTNNEILLIKNENYQRNWQNPEKVRNYIIDNWVKKGEIESFDIYEKE